MQLVVFGPFLGCVEGATEFVNSRFLAVLKGSVL